MVLATVADQEIDEICLEKAWVIAYDCQELALFVAVHLYLLEHGYRDLVVDADERDMVEAVVLEIMSDQPWADFVELQSDLIGSIWFKPGQVLVECRHHCLVARHEGETFQPSAVNWSSVEQREWASLLRADKS